MLFTNHELWYMAEKDKLHRGTIIEDREGNQMIFTGLSFQTYYSNQSENKYVGFVVGDEWEIICVDEKELKRVNFV